jgi:hypothetical protein
MDHCIVPIKYLPFYKTDRQMMKSIQSIFYSREMIQILLVLLVVESQALGQPDTKVCDVMYPEIVSGSHLLSTPYRDLNPFNKLPGEVNQWGKGTVYLQTGDSVPGRYLLYNALGSNLLWVKFAGESGLLINKSTVKGFSFRSEKDNQILKYEFFPVSGWYYSDGPGAFLEVLVKDTLSLFRLNTIERFPMSDNLKPHSYYFVQQSGRDLNRVLPNRRSLCSALEHSKEFRKHLRSLHLRANKRERIIKAIQEYNIYAKSL